MVRVSCDVAFEQQQQQQQLCMSALRRCLQKGPAIDFPSPACGVGLRVAVLPTQKAHRR
ncbi:hypothetical protein PD5205_00817 [Xanthomonas fragariae]|uniref:Uncharacterized protein n=1 Tax=Xanthomonas fragariae TaxID=48664 RepID=A0A1Y6H2M6_9XANT|nr:hypothetical protein NBC2815_03190 [Xanthomonas fragariae]SMR00415.1 hypothetical protein PD885_03194 [Xanthomonas fragariae]SMR02137.1 hypothetical protein PD5205_00817 [Xanthomonas fragariae]